MSFLTKSFYLTHLSRSLTQLFELLYQDNRWKLTPATFLSLTSHLLDGVRDEWDAVQKCILSVIHIIQRCSGITRGRVLNGELYAQRLQKLIYLHLFTDCFMKISLQSSEQIYSKIYRNLYETVCKQKTTTNKQTNKKIQKYSWNSL